MITVNDVPTTPRAPVVHAANATTTWRWAAVTDGQPIVEWQLQMQTGRNRTWIMIGNGGVKVWNVNIHSKWSGTEPNTPQQTVVLQTSDGSGARVRLRVANAFGQSAWSVPSKFAYIGPVQAPRILRAQLVHNRTDLNVRWMTTSYGHADLAHSLQYWTSNTTSNRHTVQINAGLDEVTIRLDLTNLSWSGEHDEHMKIYVRVRAHRRVDGLAGKYSDVKVVQRTGYGTSMNE
jgi:hypothetical protein